MDAQAHWEKIYTEKLPDAVSWYRPHLEKSLALIEQVAPHRSASVIDVGGGESTLVDDLLAAGYENITVLDISQKAISVNQKRLGPVSQTRKATHCSARLCAWAAIRDGSVRSAHDNVPDKEARGSTVIADLQNHALSKARLPSWRPAQGSRSRTPGVGCFVENLCHNS